MENSHLPGIIYILYLITFVLGPGVINRTFGHHKHQKLGVMLCVAAFVPFAAAGIWLSHPEYYFADFRSGYYPAGKAVLISPGALLPLTKLGVIGFASMPIVAYAFAPLSLLHLRLAIIIFSLAGLVSIFLSWHLLAQFLKLGMTQRFVLALLFVANGPLQYSFSEGNLSHIILLGLIGVLVLLRKEKSFSAGVLLGGLAIIKPPLLLFGVFFIARRNVRGLGGFVGTFALIASASLLIAGWEVNMDWLQFCIIRYSNEWLGAFNDQSIPSFILRLRSGSMYLNDWYGHVPLVGDKLISSGATALLYLVAAGCCIFSLLRNKTYQVERSSLTLDVQYMLVMSLVIVTSPLVWTHYYCWLLLPSAYLIKYGRTLTKNSLTYCFGWIAIALVTPPVHLFIFENGVLNAIYSKVGISHYLFGGMIWLFVLAKCVLQTRAPHQEDVFVARPSGGLFTAT
jgi:alpha-1,2-mannosyltransferase